MLRELWNDARYRVRSIAHRGDLDRQLDEEFEAHLAHEAAIHERRGLAPREARRQALIAFGGVQDLKERTREARGTALLDSVVQDTTYAVRGFRNKPGFAFGVCLTLALGIGANVAAFGVSKAVLLNPLPFPHPDRLVMVWAAASDDPTRLLMPTVPEYLTWRDRAPVFDAVATMGIVDGDLGADASGAPAETVVVQRSTASLFRVLGLAPILGRTFTDAEDPIDTPSNIALISKRLWLRRFGGDPEVLHQSMRIDGATTTILGVMPDEFDVRHEGIEVWMPVNWNHAQVQGSARGWTVIGRTRAGVSMADARSAMAHPGTSQGADAFPPATLQPLGEAIYGGYAQPLAILEGMVAVVFLIACANVAGLLLVRATSRRADLAIRAAMGAARGRLVRQLLIESALLTTAGGAAALIVAWIGTGMLTTGLSGLLPRGLNVAFDGGVLAFAAGVSVLAILLCGVAPAFPASRASAVEVLQASGRDAMDTRGVHRLRGALVVLQVALACVLLVWTGLLAVTVERMNATDLGGDPHGIVTFRIRFPPKRYQTGVRPYGGVPLTGVSPLPAAIADRVRKRIEAMPGVSSAAVVNHVPFMSLGSSTTFTVDGRPTAAPARANAHIVSAHYFETLKIPVVRGREFNEADSITAPWSVIVNEAMAQEFWPGQDPIGQRITLDMVPDEQPRAVVGVVADTRARLVDTGAAPTFYTPLGQQPPASLAPFLGDRLLMTFLARTTGDPLVIVPALRRLMADVDPDRPVVDVGPLEVLIGRQTETRRALLWATASLAGIATLLAAVGIYGVIAHGMARRRKEIGIRLALGARPFDVWSLALAHVGRMLAMGLAIGLALAVGLTRAIAAALWGVTATDVPTYVVVSVVMMLVALAAAAGPVHRALRVAPTASLKCD